MIKLGILPDGVLAVNNSFANLVYVGTDNEVMEILTELAEEEAIYMKDLNVFSRMELNTLIELIDVIKKRIQEKENKRFNNALSSILLAANIQPQLTK